jgi:uncharacterized repeat protein (TIGR03803 family)
MSKLNWLKTTGTTSLLLAATAVGAHAQIVRTLINFDTTDGASPFAGLVQAADGSLYGTTYAGGVSQAGTVFKMTPSGTLTTLHSFCSQSGCADGGVPFSAPVQATNGSLYGTASEGGVNGYGTIYRIAPSGVLTTLYSFCAQSACSDGAGPVAGLIQATDGDLYGTTLGGGAYGDGTVFKITLTGTLTTLYSFCAQAGYSDGAGPQAALVQASDGNFYGTTGYGGANRDGTVFQITPGGALTTLATFLGPNGANPYGTLVQASDGSLYGTTLFGGVDYGSIFRITLSGTLTSVYNFCTQSGCPDGDELYAGLIQATDGNLYGVTYQGGAEAGGTIFKITLDGALATLYSFHQDGAYPFAGLVQDTNGEFYGTTRYGGAPDYVGTVFAFSAGLGPFVETQTTSGTVGSSVRILGTNLTGATSVTFDGTPAAFTVEASSVIKATVPVGATTGTIQVVTPSATLNSNVPFTVTQ